MEKIIKNYLNYIQNICIIKKRLFVIPINHANGGFISWFLTFMHKVNGGEKWLARSWKLFTFYSKITLKIIKKSVKL